MALPAVQGGAVAQLGVALVVAVARDRAATPKKLRARRISLELRASKKPPRRATPARASAERERAPPQQEAASERQAVDESPVQQRSTGSSQAVVDVRAGLEQRREEGSVDARTLTVAEYEDGARAATPRPSEQRQGSRAGARSRSAPRAAAPPEQQHASDHRQRVLDQRAEDQRGDQALNSPPSTPPTDIRR